MFATIVLGLLLAVRADPSTLGSSYTLSGSVYAGATCYYVHSQTATGSGSSQDLIDGAISVGLVAPGTTCTTSAFVFATTGTCGGQTNSFSCTAGSMGNAEVNTYNGYVCDISASGCTQFPGDGTPVTNMLGIFCVDEFECATPFAFIYGIDGALIEAGSTGDPLIVDLFGHSFLAGTRANTEYLLYRSADEGNVITMTTGDVQGNEDGFFAVKATVTQADCGSVSVVAGPKHTATVTGDACMTDRIARGDEGMVALPIGRTGTLLAVYPHQQGEGPAFVNIKVLGVTTEFRTGCTGMLCDETHADVAL